MTPLSKNEIDELYSYESAICEVIKNERECGIGFFCELKNNEIPLRKLYLQVILY
jgi:hypothetical protein